MRTFNNQVENRCFACHQDYTRRSALIRHCRVNLIDGKTETSLSHVVEGQIALIARCVGCDHLIGSHQTLKGRGKDCNCRDKRLYAFSIRIAHAGSWTRISQESIIEKKDLESFFKKKFDEISNDSWKHPATQQDIKIEGECRHCEFYFDKVEALSQHVLKVHNQVFLSEVRENIQARTPIPEGPLELEEERVRLSSEADLSPHYPKRARWLEFQE